MPTVSLIILTHNRAEIVRKAVDHNLGNAGDMIEEIIWVDNGSEGLEFERLYNYMYSAADVCVLNARNLGVAKGYNRGMGLATQDYIVITGCDMLMPDDWLRTFKEYVTAIPQTGVACMYSCHWAERPERIRKFGVEELGGLPFVRAMPIERRIFRRDLLADFGYFPETFGLYGYDDIAWANRVEQVCVEKGLLSYVIHGAVAQHLGTEGINAYDGKDPAEYHAFKKREAEDPAKKAELARREELGWPRFTPFL